MKRRAFLKLVGCIALSYPATSSASIRLLAGVKRKKIFHSPPVPHSRKHLLQPEHINDDRVKDYLLKIRNPDAPHKDDIVLDHNNLKLLNKVVSRLRRLCGSIGFGNFGILSFDDAIRFANTHSAVGAVTRAELAFLEEIFYRGATEYGFFGEKQITTLAERIHKRDTIKIPRSGNYLFRGQSLGKYEQIKKSMGDEVLLTSGIRGIVKQFYLFLNKASKHNGNLSLASRSLAPPGYSYHASGDFDIGQRGLGAYNFSEKFTASHVFKQLAEQGYVEYRYDRDNMLGVRYEPWHIKL